VYGVREEVPVGAGGRPAVTQACRDAGIVERTCYRWCTGWSQIPLPVGGRWRVSQIPVSGRAKPADSSAVESGFSGARFRRVFGTGLEGRKPGGRPCKASLATTHPQPSVTQCVPGFSQSAAAAGA